MAGAGEDLIADTLETVTLLGSGEDGESPSAPGPLTFAWTRVSGPGTVTLGTPDAPTTTASFSAAGDQVMRLTVSDGVLTDFDDMVVHVFAPGGPRTVTIPIRVGGDDAQEQIGTTSNGFTDLESADNELGNTNNNDATRVMTGLRFTDLPIKAGSTIDEARIQFSVDEVNSSAASYEIRGQLAGNAPPFLQGNQVADGSKKNISSRTPTVASVAWNNVPAWTIIRDEGPDQRTPQLASILQEIVSQPSWARGNAVVLTIQNAAGNIGRRTAEAKDGRIPPYLALTLQDATGQRGSDRQRGRRCQRERARCRVAGRHGHRRRQARDGRHHDLDEGLRTRCGDVRRRRCTGHHRRRSPIPAPTRCG